MDAPNAPNPTNSNAQDQNVDAVQGPANLAQVPAGQIPAQVPAVQVPVQGSHVGWSKFISSTSTTTSSNTTGTCWYASAHSPDNLSKLDR